MSQDSINYAAMLQDAMRAMVRKVLERTAKEGLPGEHHFYLTFRTDHPKVRLAPKLKRLHPKEMTVVIQHQYEELKVTRDAFSVTLRFDAAPHRITVPFAALSSFADPSAPFGLHLRPDYHFGAQPAPKASSGLPRRPSSQSPESPP